MEFLGGLTPSPLLFSPYCVKFLPLPLPTFLFKSFVYYYYYSYFFSVDFFTLSFTPHRIICLYNFIFLNSFPPFLWIILILLLLFFLVCFFLLNFVWISEYFCWFFFFLGLGRALSPSVAPPTTAPFILRNNPVKRQRERTSPLPPTSLIFFCT